MDLIGKQLQREREGLKRGLKEQFKKNRDDAGRCYFSNTEKGIQFRNACLLRLRDSLIKDHESLTASTFRSEGEDDQDCDGCGVSVEATEVKGS